MKAGKSLIAAVSLSVTACYQVSGISTDLEADTETESGSDADSDTDSDSDADIDMDADTDGDVENSGNLEWVRDAAAAGSTTGLGTASFADGSSVVVGGFTVSMTLGAGEPNETTLVSEGLWDLFVAKYAPSGSLVWAKSAGGADVDSVHGIAALPDGSALVTGTFQGTATFGRGEPGETSLTATGNKDFFLAKLDSGGALSWVARAGGEYSAVGMSAAGLIDGSSVVTGRYSGTSTFGPGEQHETALTSTNEFGFFVAKFGP